MSTESVRLALAGLAAITASASGQLYAVSLDRPDIFQIDTTPTSATPPAVIAGNGFVSAANASDGQYHYAEDASGAAAIQRVDLTGIEPPVLFSRTYPTFTGGPNNNLAADGNGVLWEIDRGTANLYSLSFDEGAGTVSRTLEADLGVGPLTEMGDIAWGPDGLLYIATNSAAGNFVFDPATGATTPLSGTEAWAGIAWDDGRLYGTSVMNGSTAMFELAPATMGAVGGFLFFPTPYGLNDLAGFTPTIEEPCDPDQPVILTDDGSGVQTQTLFAGQHIDVGTVTTEIVGDDLILTYNTTGGWTLGELHAWVGVDIADMPQNRRGSPKIGHFPYTVENLAGVTTYSFTIPLDTLGISCPADPERVYYIAAHAVVENATSGGGGETAWADGDRFVERGMWGTFFTTSVTCVCDNPPPVPDQCETAFTTSFDPAATAQCFLDIDQDQDGQGDFDRWGWTIDIPDTDAAYSFPIYVRAEGCDTSIATQVGELFVSYQLDADDPTAPRFLFVEYSMFPGYTMDEVHFYAGDTLVPLDEAGEPTVALEYYTHIVDNFTGAPDENFAVTYTYQFDWDGDGVNIIAHALVCGEFN